jgi:hypothetical protein
MIMKNRLSEEAFAGSKERRSRPAAGGGMMGPATKYFDSLEEAIADHPGLSLAAALLAGVLLAFCIKRR